MPVEPTPTGQSASPCATTNLPQIRLEPVLRARAEELSPGRVRFHHELVDLDQDDDGVTAAVRDLDADEEYSVRARYLLACDAGRTVGPALGVGMVGVRDVAREISIHLTADLSAWAADPEVLIRWIWVPHMGTLAVLVPMGPERWGPESEEWVFHLNYPLRRPTRPRRRPGRSRHAGRPRHRRPPDRDPPDHPVVARRGRWRRACG